LSAKEYILDWSRLLEALFPDAKELEARLREIRTALAERPRRSASVERGWISVVCPLCGATCGANNAPSVREEVAPGDWLYICSDCRRALAYKALKELFRGEKAYEEKETVRVR